MSTDVAITLLTAVFALSSPGVANLGAAETSDAGLASEIAKTDKTIESRCRPAPSGNEKSPARRPDLRHADRNHLPPRPNHFHDGHSLPNGLRAPLLC